MVKKWFDIFSKITQSKPGVTRKQAINGKNYQDYNPKMYAKLQQKMEKIKELENLRSLLPNWEELETGLEEDKMKEKS